MEESFQNDNPNILLCQGIREYVCDLLEGGNVAFQEREKEYQFLITTAHCKECGCEIGIKGILDYNAKEIDEQFRKAEGIISLEEVETENQSKNQS